MALSSKTDLRHCSHLPPSAIAGQAQSQPSLTQAGFLIKHHVLLAGLLLSDPQSAAMEMIIPWAIFAVAAVVTAGSCSKGSSELTPLATPALEVGMDPMLHVLTVKAAQPSGCLQKAFPSSGSYLKVFNKTSEFFFPRTQQVCQAQPRSLLFHVGSPGCAHLISILRRHHGGFPQRILPD